jgi:hypothetical protein
MQSIQILGNQAIGFASGEWHGVKGSPRTLMIISVIVLVIAVVVLAVGNFWAAST